MANIPGEIIWQANNDAWFTTNASEVFPQGITIYHTDGRYKFTDGVTALSALPFLGGDGGVSGLSDVLNVSNSTGNTSIDSPNGNNKLIVSDVEAALTYDGTNEGYLNISESKAHVKHSSSIDLEAPEVRISSLTASKIVETDSSNNLISVAKNSAYNLNLGTTAGTVLEGDRITQTITNGVTDKAPSEDAVFDALALKRSTTSEMLLMNCFATGITMADATTYYFGSLINSAPLTAPNWNKFTFPNNYTITKVILTVFQNAGGSNENISLYLRYNNTTDYTITTTLDLTTPSNTSKTFTFTLGSPISVVSGGDYEFKIVTPTWATNPTLSRFFITLYGY